MIRKAFLVISSLAAVATLSLSVASFMLAEDPGCFAGPIYGIHWHHWSARRGTLEYCTYDQIDEREPTPDQSFSLAGFGVSRDAVQMPYTDLVFLRRSLRIPLWLPLALFSATPTVALIRGPPRRYRRHDKGLCLKCGYNLTGNVSGRCPECGEAV